LLREIEFKTWLGEQGQSPQAASSRVSSAKRVERYLGDLDELFSSHDKEQILEQFAYSSEDEREKRPNPSPVPIDGVLRTGLASIRQALQLYHAFWEGKQPAPGELDTEAAADPLSREKIEAAMDAFDLHETSEFEAAFSAFKEPTKYWVRSTKSRSQRTYPTKPIVGFLSGKTSRNLNGGWSQSSDAAAQLHKAGFVIVDKDDQPLPLPDEYAHLMRGAERARLVALNYFIEPSREAGLPSVTIRAGDLHDLCGLERNWANVCQALEGEKFRSLARVSAPTIKGPSRSTTTEFTFELEPRLGSKGNDMRAPVSTVAQTLILYGPPGTGKTFSTMAESVRLCGEPVPEDRDDLMITYQGLLAAGRIEFVTFHQSMAYEEFVEGRQPMTGTDECGDTSTAGFRLETVPGIFRRIAKRAETSRGHSSTEEAVRLGDRQVFKMSIGEANNPEDAHLFEEAIQGNYTLLGYEDIDWSGEKFANRQAIMQACRNLDDRHANIGPRNGEVQAPFTFRNEVNEGDIVIVSKGNLRFRAIGVFTGGYEFSPRTEGGYAHRRAVRWLWNDRDGVSVNEIYAKNFQQQPIYKLNVVELNVPALERYMNSQQSDGPSEPEPFVLIIDEINRANISKVFGELITLLEPDKRLGQPNEIKVRLPYSGDDFGVPSNLHIVGTMNTADRSIALLDTALRRRFTFRELMPDGKHLDDAGARTGIDLALLLTTINERVEYLYDRDHQIGHAYFTACQTLSDVDEVMRHKVIPLLAEYFFEDWAKIAAVLGDLESHEGTIDGGFLKRSVLKAPPGLDNGEAMPRFRWAVRSTAEGFDYSRLLGP